ncbi:hypothetical protein [Fusobacterium sp.]|uniref:hypothetical protein n=1 Tax=Fusobacterium sp. TaxID=68766 RepID=UPI00396C879A
MKIKYLLLITMIFISGCSSLKRSSIARHYNKLDRRLDKLMEDEIDEKKRADLEKKFENLKSEITDYRSKNLDESIQYTEDYLRDVNIRLEYLKDLKD